MTKTTLGVLAHPTPASLTARRASADAARRLLPRVASHSSLSRYNP